MLTKTRAQDTLISPPLLATGTHPGRRESRWITLEEPPYPGGRQEPEQFGLTARERDVLCLLACRQTDAEIADRLFISYRTVTTHVTHIIDKLGVRNRRDAAAMALRHGLIEMGAWEPYAVGAKL
jgi:DNA-binding CsgD family transcriptional regulator